MFLVAEMLDPIIHDVNLKDRHAVQSWRQFLQKTLLHKRGWKCEACKVQSEFFDLHEGIVTKGDVQGWPYEKRGLIFCEVNCFNLDRDCHKNWGAVFPREKAWKLSCERYGEEKVREWYEGLPWKAGVPRRFWECGD